MENDGEQFKTVAEFSDLVSAQMTVAKLGDAGIPAAVFGADSSYPCLALSRPIEVKVNASDYEEAMSILAASDSAE